MNNEEEFDILPIEVRIATIEIMLMSLHKTLGDTLKAIHPKNKIESYDKWYEECEENAKYLLKKQKEKESEE